jgi:hypothetical protein
MPKPRKQAAPGAPAPPQVGDKVYPPRSELVYEISQVHVGGNEVDLHVPGTNLERFRVRTDALRYVQRNAPVKTSNPFTNAEPVFDGGELLEKIETAQRDNLKQSDDDIDILKAYLKTQRLGTSTPRKKTKASKPIKRVFAITLTEPGPFAFAGIWDAWKRPDGTYLETFAIVTTEPNELVAKIHDRLALILHPRDYDRWLGIDDRGGDTRPPFDLLHPYDADKMKMTPANPAVGNWRNNGREMLDGLSSHLAG